MKKVLMICLLIRFAFGSVPADSAKWIYLDDQIGLAAYSVGAVIGSIGARNLIADFADGYPYVYQMANKRGLWDGLDRETHFVGGFGLYYYLRSRGNSKARSMGLTTIGSLLWELKDSFRFMDYRNEWFRKTSVGNVLIHFAGDGFDIQDHWCVMLGAGSAIGIEYLNEGIHYIWPKAKLKLFGLGLAYEL